MAKKPGITFSRHDEVAAELYSIREKLLSMEVELANSFPRSGPASKPYKAISAARVAIDTARSDLENLMFRDHPDNARLGIYYNRQKLSSPA